jgi:RHS repeat-associated protein
MRLFFVINNATGLLKITGPNDVDLLEFVYTYDQGSCCGGSGSSSLWKIIDPDGKYEEFSYYEYDSLKTIKRRDDSEVDFYYNEDLSLSEIEYDDNTIEYNYTQTTGQYGLLSEIIDDFAKIKYYWSDEGLNLIEKVDQIFDYDTEDEHTETIEYDYNNSGRLTSMETDFGTYNYSYDDLSRIVSIFFDSALTGDTDKFTTYTYESQTGNISQILCGNSNGIVLKTSYTYDDLDRMTRMDYRKSDDSLIRRFDYTYDSQFFIETQKIYSSDSQGAKPIEWHEYEYDTLGRLTKSVDKDQDGNVISTIEYQMDDKGNHTAQIEDATTTSLYYYDSSNMNQLTKVKEDEITRTDPGSIDVWGTVSVDEGSTISFIKVNTLDATHSGGYFSKDDISLNEVSSQQVVAVVQDSRGYITTDTVTVYFDETADIAFAYDLRGNMVYKSDKGEETLYIYDQRNYLREARLPNHDIVRFETDSLGRRLKREFYDASEVNWTTQYYLMEDIDALVDFDGSWNMEAYYINHPGVDMIAIMDKGENEYYFITDHLGSVRLVIDSNGDNKEQYEYSPYGDLTIKNQYGTTISKSGIDNRFTFTGREWDEDLKLYYYRARWYDPKTRRFSQRDKYLGYNLYLYCQNNPLNYIDPLGLKVYARTICGSIKPYIKYLKGFYELDPCSQECYKKHEETHYRQALQYYVKINLGMANSIACKIGFKEHKIDFEMEAWKITVECLDKKWQDPCCSKWKEDVRGNYNSAATELNKWLERKNIVPN